MVEQANTTKSHDELCAELRDALAAQRSIIASGNRHELIVDPGVQPGPVLPLESSGPHDSAVTAGAEEEIARLEAALREHGCG